MLDLYHLQALAEIARLGSYRAAAKSLGFTQPAISYRMRALERALGMPLAVKVGRGARLTPAGMKLAQRAEELLAALNSLEREFQSYAALTPEKVTIAASGIGSTGIIPRAVARLRATHPDVTVALKQASCSDPYGALRAGEVDLALMWELDSVHAKQNGSVPDPEMLRIPLAVDRRCVLLPLEHSQEACQTVRLEDLADEYWIMESGRTDFTAACHMAGFQPNVVATADDQHAIRDLVAIGVGVAMVDGLGAAWMQSPEVVVRLLDGCPPRRVFGLLWPDMIKVPAVTVLVEALRSTVSESFPDQPDDARARWVTALTGESPLPPDERPNL